LKLGVTRSSSARATQSVEHCVVQQFFFRLVGILARTSAAGNAYAPIFFVVLKFSRNPRAVFCHMASVSCRERGATFNCFGCSCLLLAQFYRAEHGKSCGETCSRAVCFKIKFYNQSWNQKVSFWSAIEGDRFIKNTQVGPLAPRLLQSGTKGQNSFILIVCPAQTILSRSSTSQCLSALFNPTGAAVPKFTVFVLE